MANKLLTPEEMSKMLIDVAREACDGDEKLMAAVIEMFGADLLNMDMKGKHFCYRILA